MENAPDRNAVTAASRAIDVRLGHDPLSQGEAREGNLRILFVPPLAVLFEVELDDCRVTVLDVWHYSP
jgi:hypothetical protein